MSLSWVPDNQPNGIGWMTRCGNFAIRECRYLNGQATEYWCYYKVSPGDKKFMHIPEGVRPSLEEAVKLCEVKNG